jgi:hypothetical protein
MKQLIGYYNEQGKYIEELVDIIEKTKEDIIKEKEEMLLKLTKEIENLKKL